MDYLEYIASPAWRSLRQRALERDSHRCRICDSAERLEVHHRRYPPRGEWHLDCLDALTTLCVPCHDIRTAETRRLKYALQNHVADDVRRLAPVVEMAAPREADITITDVRRASPHQTRLADVAPTLAVPDVKRNTPNR